MSQTKKVDLILRNARIIDGTGGPSQYGDVAIQDDRLLAVGETGNIQASRELDVGGKVVCPGPVLLIAILTMIDCYSLIQT